MPRLAAIAGLALLGANAGTVPSMHALLGHYARAFDSEMLDGSTYPARDTVDIAPVDATHAYVHAELQFANGDTCSIAAIATWAGDRLVYRERMPQPGDTPCQLTVSAQGKALVLDDAGGTCQAYCGARGSFSDHRFLALAARRPIARLAALKRSGRYRAAIEDWKSGGAE